MSIVSSTKVNVTKRVKMELHYLIITFNWVQTKKELVYINYDGLRPICVADRITYLLLKYDSVL